MIYILLVLTLNLIISFVISNRAKSRECNPTWIFWSSFLLSPIVGMFLVLASKERKETEPVIIDEVEFKHEPDWIQSNPEKAENIITWTFGLLIIGFVCFVFVK